MFLTRSIFVHQWAACIHLLATTVLVCRCFYLVLSFPSFFALSMFLPPSGWDFHQGFFYVHSTSHPHLLCFLFCFQSRSSFRTSSFFLHLTISSCSLFTFRLLSDNFVTANVARESLRRRSSLLPYFYTRLLGSPVFPIIFRSFSCVPAPFAVLVDSHLHGSLIWHPIWFWFPHDQATHLIEDQVIIGDALMVRPVLTQEESHNEKVLVYFPREEKFLRVSAPDSATSVEFLARTQWFYSLCLRLFSSIIFHCVRDRFDLSDGLLVSPGKQTSNSSGFWASISAPLNSTLPLFIRSGSIIPRQVPFFTLFETHRNPITLAVAIPLLNSLRCYSFLGTSVSNLPSSAVLASGLFLSFFLHFCYFFTPLSTGKVILCGTMAFLHSHVSVAVMRGKRSNEHCCLAVSSLDSRILYCFIAFKLTAVRKILITSAQLSP